MKKGTIVLLAFALIFTACKSTIEEFDEDERVLTRKFGPDDLRMLSAKLMTELDAFRGDWMRGSPTLAIADFRNNTDQPGLEKQVFFDQIETDLFKMNKFDLMDHQETQALLKEAGYHLSDQFDNSHAIEVGKAIRARYIMWGDISLSSDIGADGSAIKQYRLSLKVTDVETHRIVYRDTATAKVKAVR